MRLRKRNITQFKFEKFEINMGDKKSGITQKFNVSRTDKSDLQEGDKHFNCKYFVLDLTHDKHAIPAIIAYAESARKDGYEALASDLKSLAIADLDVV